MFTPVEGQKGYTFEGHTRLGALFAGIAVKPPSWIPKGLEGTEHIGPEDMPDADYGRLLEKAYVKVVATLEGFESYHVREFRGESKGET